ncbi:hypothetical protein GPL15_10955 [Clostridium sp. MCC353]|uniref:GTPase domain-containing protein n=1 Tax=Clostridium sp. MCC353 TaxID=2592646 RepID=UPI001C022FD0|nr:GTPase domain-containing protein [Clostridium sp. MCC353]MBT9777019.1 hypothetical protein [Clostridium sp. MCC353]
MESNLNYFCEDKIRLEKLLSDLSDILKDTDDRETKEKIQSAVRQMVKAYRIMVIGERQSGRTSLLNQMFLCGKWENTGGGLEKTDGIVEICFGAAQAEIRVADGFVRKFVTDEELKGLVLTDVGGEELYRDRRIEEMSLDSQVILAVFSAENIQSAFVWEFIERHCLKKKVICVLNKTDLYPPEIIESKKRKLHKYMLEAGIEAPVFCMSAIGEPEKQRENREMVRAYMKHSIIGEHPEIERNEVNLQELTSLFRDLKVSFEKRSLQFAADRKILLFINEKMDSFYRNQNERAEKLKKEVFTVVHQEIEDYSSSIIKKLDFNKIQNDMDTSSKTVFMEWLQHEIDKRERIMNQKVQNKVQAVLQWYYEDLEEAYEEITDRLSNRPQILEMDDRFYGTLQEGKHNAVTRAIEVAESSNEGFSSLYSVTEELYKKVKREKDQYEHMKNTAGILGSAAGLIKGGIITGGLSTVPILFTLVMGTAGVYAAMQLFEYLYDGKAERNVEKYVREFKDKVSGIEEQMITELGERLDLVFGRLLDGVDKTFMPFRTTTNIDSRNIPLLEEKLREAEYLYENLMRSLEGA